MVVAEATLAAEKSLNALNFDMARDLFAAAEEWHTDDSIAAIIISGAGVRAFCAGGDVRQVCVAVADNPQAAGDYFAAEYRADFALHCINKPLLCFAGGIVMGGGVGIMQACNIRIATDTTMLAMPETAIGAIPDVGAARFLRAAFDGGGGFFLGISGAAINGAESQAAGLADYLINDNCRTQLIDRLCETDWQTNADDNKRIAKTLLGELTKTHPPQTKPAPMLQVRKQIAEVATTADAFAVCDNDNNNAFLQTAAKKMRTASPQWHCGRCILMLCKMHRWRKCGFLRALPFVIMIITMLFCKPPPKKCALRRIAAHDNPQWHCGSRAHKCLCKMHRWRKCLPPQTNYRCIERFLRRRGDNHWHWHTDDDKQQA